MSLEWTPTERQEDFLSLPDTIYEALFGGAAGGAKTETLMMLPLVKEYHRHPRFKMLFLRRTYPELESEVIVRTQERGFYSGTGGTYNNQYKRWQWPGGGLIQFGHCEHEKDVKKYDTSEYNIIAFDECTSFTPYQYEYLTMSRCRSSSPDLPAYVRSGTNPGGISHGYFRDRFVKPAREGYTIIKEKKIHNGLTLELRRIFIPSRVEDNPHITKNDPTYVARLASLPEAERAAKLYGDWWTFSGQVFDDWRTAPFPDEPAWANHVIEPFKIPAHWVKILAIDWGYSANTVAGWYAINPVPNNQVRAKVIKYREFVCKKTKVSEWAQAVKDLSRDEDITLMVLDPSAWGQRGDEFTIAQQVMQASGFSPMRADNDRIGGKILLQEYLRWKELPEITADLIGEPNIETELRILRQFGETERQKYVQSFKAKKRESYLPKFQVFNTCAETIKVIPLCVYDKKSVEDVAEFDGDDAYDETRYGLKACQLYLDGGVDAHREIQERNKTLELVNHTDRPVTQSELTSFYIRMQSLDKRSTVNSNYVRKFHRRRPVNR